MKETIKKYTISEEETHVGLLEYSEDVNLVLPLNKYFDVVSINEQIDNLKPSSGIKAVTDEVLRRAADLIFDIKKGGRPTASRILVIVTDEKLSGKVSASVVTRPLIDAGVRVYVVTYGDRTDKDDFGEVVPDGDNVEHEEETKDLIKVIPSLVETVTNNIRKRKF